MCLKMTKSTVWLIQMNSNMNKFGFVLSQISSSITACKYIYILILSLIVSGCEIDDILADNESETTRGK